MTDDELIKISPKSGEHPVQDTWYPTDRGESRDEFSHPEECPYVGNEYSTGVKELTPDPGYECISRESVSPIPQRASLIESVVPKTFKSNGFRSLDSLAPGKWISSTILEDLLNYFVSCYEKESSIMVIFSWAYYMLVVNTDRFGHRSQLVRLLHSEQAVNKDIALVIVSTDALLLGAFLYKIKKFWLWTLSESLHLSYFITLSDCVGSPMPLLVCHSIQENGR